MKLLRKIYRKFPLKSAEEWDHSGYQLGRKNPQSEIAKVFLCLDFTEVCLDEIKRVQPDLILTHHPYFFGKRSEILLSDPLKAKLTSSLECYSTPLYSFHTNYDKGKEGMNDYLLSLLLPGRLEKADMMSILELDEEITFSQLLDRISAVYSFDHLDYLGSEKKVKRIGLLAGGGSSYYKLALENNVDCYLSGDCPHHTRLDMQRYNLNYVDLPHEVEEQGFLGGMKKALLSIDPSLNVTCFAYEKYFKHYTRGDNDF